MLKEGLSSGLLSFFTTGGDFFMWSYFRASASHRSRCWSSVARTSANLGGSGFPGQGLGFRVQGSGPSISKDAEKGAHIPTSGNILCTIIHAMVWPRLLPKIQGAAHPLAARPCSTSLGDDLPSAVGCATDIRSTSQSSSPIPCVLL